jgi:hypothetical protein
MVEINIPAEKLTLEDLIYSFNKCCEIFELDVGTEKYVSSFFERNQPNLLASGTIEYKFLGPDFKFYVQRMAEKTDIFVEGIPKDKKSKKKYENFCKEIAEYFAKK